MRCDCLSDKERIFLYKCVLRHHKENGSNIEFTRTTNFSKDNFLVKKTSLRLEIHEYLIGPVWNVYMNYKGQSDENEILASVFFIKLLDLIYDSDYKIFKRISSEIAVNEFNYMDSAVEQLKNENPVLLKKVKAKVNEIWDKYGFLSIKKLYNIPID